MGAVSLDAFGFSSYSGFNARLIQWRYDLLSQFFVGTRCLELGSSDGQGTLRLLEHFESVTAVDGSAAATLSLRTLVPDPRLCVVTSFFEDLELGRFDTVVAAHVLEHVDDPAAVLAVASQHLEPEGVLLLDVPNAMSLHRQMGVLMGMIGRETDLNEADVSIGHKRVYTPELFRAQVEGAGFEIVTFGGIFLKLLSNVQMESFDDAQLDAMRELGERYPELASEIFVVAQSRER